MATAALQSIVKYSNELLRSSEFKDYDNAHNGLQVSNDGKVSKIIAAVDASLATVRLAVAERADLMVVHHGLFWNPSYPWVGPKYELLKELIVNNLAVYSSHLPL